MTKVVLIGNGGHARVITSILIKQGIDVIGYTAPTPESSSFQYIGADEVIYTYRTDEIYLVNGLGSIDTPKLRRKVYEMFKRKGYSFLSVIHPKAVVDSNVQVGEGVQVMAGAVIQPGAEIEENTIINTSASIDHDCFIGPHSHIAPGVTCSGEVKIEGNCHIGTGATVIQGLHIGENSVVGAGSVVTRNVERNVVAYGTPATVRRGADE